MTRFETTLWAGAMALGVTLATAVPSTAAAAYCSGGCPETGFHDISIRNLFGTKQSLTGADTYTLGTNSEGLLVACDTSTSSLYFLYDEDLGDYLYDGLEDDSAICWDDQRDIITVLKSQTNLCGLNPMYPFAYNNNRLMMHGEDGNDELRGGSGRDKLCGGIGDDILHGYGHNDVVDGLSGDDTLVGGTWNDELWGYTGRDCLRDSGGSYDTLRGEGDDDRCVHDSDWHSTDLVDCGGEGNTPNTSAEADNCTDYGYAYCDTVCSFP